MAYQGKRRGVGPGPQECSHDCGESGWACTCPGYTCVPDPDSMTWGGWCMQTHPGTGGRGGRGGRGGKQPVNKGWGK